MCETRRRPAEPCSAPAELLCTELVDGVSQKVYFVAAHTCAGCQVGISHRSCCFVAVALCRASQELDRAVFDPTDYVATSDILSSFQSGSRSSSRSRRLMATVHCHTPFGMSLMHVVSETQHASPAIDPRLSVVPMFA